MTKHSEWYDSQGKQAVKPEHTLSKFARATQQNAHKQILLFVNIYAKQLI